MRVGIIGGGINGSALAYFLARDGSVDVELFERESIGGVSTARSAGIIVHHYPERTPIRLAQRGYELLAELDAQPGVDVGLHRNGCLLLADDSGAEAFRETVDLQRDVGVDVELLDPSDVDTIVPGADPGDATLAAIERDAGFADPYLAATGFANAAREHGATVNANTPVTDIVAENGQVTAVETPDGRRELDYLVNAGGPYAADVAAMIGVELPLQPTEAKIAVLRSSRPFGPDLPTVVHGGSGLYAKPEPGGEFIVGGIEERDPDAHRLDDPGSLGGVTNEDLRWVSRKLDRYLPGYADAEVIETWSGPITDAPDKHQLVGIPDGFENFHVIAGGSGHGFKEGAAFAESIAQSILGSTPDIDLSPYRLTRFEEGEPLTTRAYHDDRFHQQ